MVQPEPIDTTIAHGARMYDYWLGGDSNYPPDRVLGDQIREQIPTIAEMARANRAFLGRAVRYLVAEAGIRQFLDIGSGIPTAPNVHQLAQRLDPTARVLYVDSDPLVLELSQDTLTSTEEGRVAFLHGDFLDPESILGSELFEQTIDRREPVALLLVAMLMYFDPAEGNDPYPVVRALTAELPAGSHVVLTHPTGDFDPAALAGVQEVGRQAGMTILPRNQAQVGRFLDGLELVEPGVVPVLSWRPDNGQQPTDPRSAYYWAAAARKS